MPAQYEVVDGTRLPAPLGGHPALDFCNTWAGWDGHATGDYLTSYDDLALWAGHSGLLPAGRTRRLRLDARGRADDAQSVLGRARALRTGLYEIFSSDAGRVPWPQPVVDEFRNAVGACTWERTKAGGRWLVLPGAGLAAPLVAVAWSALGLLSSTDPEKVRTCPGPGCGWLFLDASGRRKWCSMAACGNRAKARRFADRARSTHPASG